MAEHLNYIPGQQRFSITEEELVDHFLLGLFFSFDPRGMLFG
jgi:hypothetical protein